MGLIGGGSGQVLLVAMLGNGIRIRYSECHFCSPGQKAPGTAKDGFDGVGLIDEA